jgi:hypothetical protein
VLEGIVDGDAFCRGAVSQISNEVKERLAHVHVDVAKVVRAQLAPRVAIVGQDDVCCSLQEQKTEAKLAKRISLRIGKLRAAHLKTSAGLPYVPPNTSGAMYSRSPSRSRSVAMTKPMLLDRGRLFMG